ncbi:MAG: TrkA family potassium uptake protein [Clostridiales bacterium]|nr:TrkA family potassium uptake protein [Clostridiales bacterium]
MKSFLIIGVGKFGYHLCENLLELKNDVMLVDKNEARMADFIHRVTNVQIGDCTNKQVVESLGVGNFDIVFVCIGSNFQNSLVITDLVKECGAKYVVSKADRDVDSRFLKKIGADEVVYPDHDLAVKVARRFSVSHVFDYTELNDEYGIYEIPVPRDWAGRTIEELNIRQKYDVNVLGIRSADKSAKISPSANYCFEPEEHIFVLGKRESIEKILKKFKDD